MSLFNGQERRRVSQNAQETVKECAKNTEKLFVVLRIIRLILFTFYWIYVVNHNLSPNSSYFYLLSFVCIYFLFQLCLTQYVS